jgi:2-oxoisovalerate dehydrogenase E1 component alpha subunit
MSDSEIGISGSRVVDAEGKIVGPMPEFARDPAELLRLSGPSSSLGHSTPRRLRCNAPDGPVPTHPRQEAVSVGAASAMRPNDVFLPSFREHAPAPVKTESRRSGWSDEGAIKITNLGVAKQLRRLCDG